MTCDVLNFDVCCILVLTYVQYFMCVCVLVCRQVASVDADCTQSEWIPRMEYGNEAQTSLRDGEYSEEHCCLVLVCDTMRCEGLPGGGSVGVVTFEK